MRKQRRDYPHSLATWIGRLWCWFRRQPAKRFEPAPEMESLPSGAHALDAPVGRPAAPPFSLVRIAAFSLPSDHHFDQLVCQQLRSGPPGLPGSPSAAAVIPASPRSSVQHVPSVFASIHATLPQAPEVFPNRAERYDGKRDLHFLHAA